jgi:hypothetical protein
VLFPQATPTRARPSTNRRFMTTSFPRSVSGRHDDPLRPDRRATCATPDVTNVSRTPRSPEGVARSEATAATHPLSGATGPLTFMSEQIVLGDYCPVCWPPAPTGRDRSPEDQASVRHTGGH